MTTAGTAGSRNWYSFLIGDMIWMGGEVRQNRNALIMKNRPTTTQKLPRVRLIQRTARYNESKDRVLNWFYIRTQGDVWPGWGAGTGVLPFYLCMYVYLYNKTRDSTLWIPYFVFYTTLQIHTHTHTHTHLSIHGKKFNLKKFWTTGPGSVFSSGYQVSGISGYPGRHPIPYFVHYHFVRSPASHI